MALNLPTFDYYHDPNSRKLTMVTHGASEGLDSPFMKELIKKIKGKKTCLCAIQMPFKDRGESQSSGKELKEELEALQQLLDFTHYREFEKIHFIGKSLGGIIFSQFLSKQPANFQSRSDLTILGYIYTDTVIPDSIASINIIQGEYDKYGTREQLQQELDKSPVKNKLLNLVKGADHSYRNSNKEPEFFGEAVELI